MEMNKRGVFFLFTSKDIYDHIVVFGLGLVHQEDGPNWRWFVELMKTALQNVGVAWKHPFVSDRQKGLIGAVTDLYPHSGHRFCIRHIITNAEKLTSSLAPAEKALIFQMARSEYEKDYKFYSSKLADTRPLVVEYLNKINKSHWVTYAFSEEYEQPSYDEVTSNLSESSNQWLGNSCRSAYPMQAFEQYFVKFVELFARRRRDSSRREEGRVARDDNSVADRGASAKSYDQLAPVHRENLNKMLAVNKKLMILPCLGGQYMVRFTDLSSRADYVHLWRTVNLAEKECTCRKWQDTQFPCVHAVKAAIHHGMHVSELFEWEEHTAAACRDTYFYQFVLGVSTSRVVRDDNLIAPTVIVEAEELGKRGRKPGPPSKHKRKASKPGTAAAPTVAMTQ